jgi:hypothetical protein
VIYGLHHHREGKQSWAEIWVEDIVEGKHHSSHHHQLELHLGIKLWTKGVIFFKFNDIKN